MNKLKKLISQVQTYIGILLLILGPSTSYMFAKPRDGPKNTPLVYAVKDAAVCRELQLAYDNERRKLTLLKIVLAMLAMDSGSNPTHPAVASNPGIMPAITTTMY